MRKHKWRYTAPNILILILQIGYFPYLFAQTDSIAFVFQDAIENAVASNESSEFDFDTEFEHLKDFILHPLNINRATSLDFETLRLLSNDQIKAIIQHREKRGLYITLYELQSVLDLETIRRILPFITIDGDLDDFQIQVKEWFKKGKNQAFMRVERRLQMAKGFKKEYSNGGFKGDRFKTYFRYRYAFSNKLSHGVTLEKDVGEKWTAPTDFTSFHFKIQNPIKHIKTLCVGDYVLSIGQGLIHENGFSMGKSSQVLNIEKSQPVLKQYTASNEYNFLRGVALNYKITPHTEGVMWASYRRRDGNIVKTTEPPFDEYTISSLQTTGLHRTRNEIEDKNSTRLLTLGGRFLKTIKKGSIAFNALFNQFDKAINPRKERYNEYYFRGKTLLNISTDYKYTFENIHAFGETAMSDNGGWATLNGFLIGLNKRLSLAILQRFFSLKYQALNAQPFSESSRVNDEMGLYTGLNYNFNKKWAISAYVDFWKHQGWRFRVDAPSSGHEFLLKSSFKHHNTEGYVQFRTKMKQENATRPDTGVVNKIKNQYRLHFQHKVSSHWILRNRLEFSQYFDAQRTNGVMLYQDVIYNMVLKKHPLSITSRLAVFNTHNFDTAIYAYENDVLYSFTITPYYYKGVRAYINIFYEPIKNATFELRCAHTYLSNRDIIGSGLDEIEGNQRTDFKMQFQYQF